MGAKQNKGTMKFFNDWNYLPHATQQQLKKHWTSDFILVYTTAEIFLAHFQSESYFLLLISEFWFYSKVLNSPRWMLTIWPLSKVVPSLNLVPFLELPFTWQFLNPPFSWKEKAIAMQLKSWVITTGRVLFQAM